MRALILASALGLCSALAVVASCGDAGPVSASSSSTTGAGGAGGLGTTGVTGAATTSSTSSTSSTGSGGAGQGGAGGAPPVDAGPACSPDVPRAVPLTVWAEPEAGEAPFVDALASAELSIRVMVYEMGFGGILDALKQKAALGVKVQVILDLSKQSINQKYFDQLGAAGAEVRWSDPAFTYMHAKVLVVDEALSVISTGNYLASQMKKERNYVARDDDPDDVADLVALFDADWEKLTPDLSCTRLLVSPVNARERLLAFIQGAQSTLEIESMQLADTQVRAALVDRKEAGVAIRALLADPTWIDANAGAAAFLAQNAIPARYQVAPAVHVKSIIADGERAYLGSENLSYTSLSKNREVGLIAHEPAVVQTMSATFEGDWAQATPF